MALNRRTGQRFQASIWPGFVDAMTGLLLVLMFVLTIFTVIQFVLTETISGQESEMSELSQEVAALADALGLERQRNTDLTGQVGRLTVTLDDAEAQVSAQSAMILALQRETASQSAALDEAAARITAFEDRVAALLAEREQNLGAIADLETTRDDLMTEQEALNLALAHARDEMDAQLELARLSAAREEALQALIENLRQENADTSTNLAAALASLTSEQARTEDLSQQLLAALASLEETQEELSDTELALSEEQKAKLAEQVAAAALRDKLADTESALSDEEKAKLAEAAAAETLRNRLQEAQTELTAMTLALEAKRKEAEDTLTLLAASRDAEERLNEKLAAALLANAELDLRLEKTVAELDEVKSEEAEKGSKLSSVEAALVQALLDLESGLSAKDEVALQLETATAELTDARERERKLNRQLAALSVQIEQKEEELANLTVSYEAEKTARVEAVEALNQAGVARNELTDLLAQARSAEEMAVEQSAKLASDLDRSQEQVSTLIVSLDDALESATQAREQAANFEVQLAEALARKAGITDERDSLEQRLAAALAAKLSAQTGLAEKADLEEQLAAALQAKLAAEQAASEAESDLSETQTSLEELRTKLATALVDQQTAREEADLQISEAEKARLLLATAKDELSQAEGREADAHREMALLNQQVEALRTQLASLQAILDISAEADREAQVRIQSLGAELNAALARAAAQARKAESEAKVREGLEAEIARLLRAEKDRLEAENAALEKDLEKYRSDFFGRLRDVVGDREGVQIVGDRFVFSSEVLFPSGRAELSEEGRDEIANIASLLLQISREIPREIDWIIRVDGHTDNIRVLPGGEFKDNWELSQARALSVVRDLVNLGVSPDRLSANGFGEFQPLNSANDATARAQNRRIELKLTER